MNISVENSKYVHILTGDLVYVRTMDNEHVEYEKSVAQQVGRDIIREFIKPMYVFKAMYRKQFTMKNVK
jgi:hypothetical protein